MKSISPRKEKNENMPSMCISSEGREVKSVFLSYQTNQGQAESNKESQNPDLIRCNSDLANSFQILRTKTIGMGHPGHYFQKALNSVTQKSRSQSLPSCLESKKVTSAPVNESDKEVEAPSKPHESNEVSVITVKVNNVTNETWFRTWPERGNDKLVTPHNNNVNGCHLDSRLEKSGCEGPEDCSGCSCLGKEHQTIEEKVIVNHSDNICKKLTKAIGFSPEKSFKLDECALKTNPNESIQTVGLQRNDLLTNCDTENYSNIQHSSPLKSLYSLDSDCINSGKAPIPLTELLQNIPLAYSPVTRQLHIISSNHTVIDDEDSEDSKKKLQVHQNGLKQPLESIEEEGLVDGCQSLTKCSEDDSVSFESPRSTLQRFGASSLSRTDASSFSSIVSSLSDASPSSTNDEPDDSVLTLHGSPSESSDCYDEEIGGTKSKRKGLSSFFSRNVFAWKTSRDAQNNNSSSSNSCSSSGGSTPGWKLFGRLASKPLEQESATILEPGQLPDSPASIRSTGSGNKRYEDIIASSSALILHNRPSSLPAKSLDEEQKHRLEYQQMVEAARKKEMKEAKLRKKQLQRQLKVEEQLANAARIWNNEILPKWEMMKTSRKARDLWWQGIPPSVRGKVWKLAIGNELNVTHDLYNICLSRAQERLKDVGEATTTQIGDNVDKEASMELIQLDIARTFPHLCIFQRGGPYYDILHCLLGAYVCYRPDVGYVQGMSFIAAVLILNLEAPDAFICFSNLLNRPCHMAFFCLNQKLMSAYYAAYNEFFRENLPRLYTHFTESSLSADLYLLDWLYTVFAKAMPLDVACRVWDVFLRDGEEFLFKAALGVLHLNQEVLLKLDFIHGAQFLTKLPDDLAADQLFKSIETIHMNVGKQRFSEVLAYHIDKCQQEQR